MKKKIDCEKVSFSYFTTTLMLSLFVFLTFGNSAYASSAASIGDSLVTNNKQIKKKLAYIVSDSRIPFWDIMGRGIKNTAQSLGYEFQIYTAENSAKNELASVAAALRDNVSGIIVSPTSSSACVTILKWAKKAGVPVVISDIGTDGGDYVSYISSNNKEGAYQVGKILAQKMRSMGWQDGSVGIVAIPQKRLNGQLRTTGFMQAMDEAGIKGADIKQQFDFSYEETYNYTRLMIEKYAALRAIFIQGSDRYQGALDAIEDTGKRKKVLLVSFDAEPIFLDLIPEGVIVGAAMQQPYLMGEKAAILMDKYLQGKPVEKDVQLSILAVSEENITEKLAIIKRNVLGIDAK